MSTLAAARADNMYYPPEWRPEMGGISKFQGSKGHNQYEQYGKIRFELPVHGWCLGCGRHIGRVRGLFVGDQRSGSFFLSFDCFSREYSINSSSVYTYNYLR